MHARQAWVQSQESSSWFNRLISRHLINSVSKSLQCYSPGKPLSSREFGHMFILASSLGLNLVNNYNYAFVTSTALSLCQMSPLLCAFEASFGATAINSWWVSLPSISLPPKLLYILQPSYSSK